MEDDELEFRQFVSARWRPLVSTAFLVTGDVGLAEDCVQEALVRVHRRWTVLHRDGNPEAYTKRAVFNAALSWRRRRRISTVPLDSVVDPPAMTAQDHELDVELVRALRSLPPVMRAAVVLRHVEDCSESETARILGCSVGAVKSSTHRGLARLRAALVEPLPLPPEGSTP